MSISKPRSSTLQKEPLQAWETTVSGLTGSLTLAVPWQLHPVRILGPLGWEHIFKLRRAVPVLEGLHFYQIPLSWKQGAEGVLSYLQSVSHNPAEILHVHPSLAHTRTKLSCFTERNFSECYWYYTLKPKQTDLLSENTSAMPVTEALTEIQLNLFKTEKCPFYQGTNFPSF